MISIVMPYWKRADTAKRAFNTLRQYDYLDFEVVCVDDGCHDLENPGYPWLRIERLEKKEIAKNPCVPINHGVKVSHGDVIVITGPDILHNTPVLPKMLQELHRTGENGYVLAACWYERENEWHCHSSLIDQNGWHRCGVKQPKGSGFHFCAMFNRSLWDKSGGFDERYRDGVGYDDPDWVNRVAKAGAVFRMRDDLIVEHTRDGAESQWSENSNRALYNSLWPT